MAAVEARPLVLSEGCPHTTQRCEAAPPLVLAVLGMGCRMILRRRHRPRSGPIRMRDRTAVAMITLGLEEAAKIVRCHPDTLRKLAVAREVPSTKIGREWLFLADQLEEWLRGRCRSTV